MVTYTVKVVVSKKWSEIDTLLQHTTNRQYHMAYLFVPFPMTLDNIEGHSPNAGLIQCKSTTICATFSTVSTDTARRAVRCWCGYLSGARCRLFAYGPVDATAIPNPTISCLIWIQTGFAFLVPAYQVVLEKRPLNGVLVAVSVVVDCLIDCLTD